MSSLPYSLTYSALETQKETMNSLCFLLLCSPVQTSSNSLDKSLLATAAPGLCQGLLPCLPLLLLYCGLLLSLGWILIDRCGKHFGTILNYLRDGAVPLPESRREIEELLAEAKYYLVQGLVDECQAALQVGCRAKEEAGYSGCSEGQEEEAALGGKQHLGRAASCSHSSHRLLGVPFCSDFL